MSYWCPRCNSFPDDDYVWWVSAEKNTPAGGVRSVEKNLIVERQTGSWWCKQAKVSTRLRFAHAVPQGLCENLINALKLLANQQEGGDGLFQSIVTNLCEGSRKGLTEGLRNFLKVDNHRALEVGHLREGSRSLKVRRPKCEEGSPEVLVRESPEELTLSAEEVGTQKSCINVDHIVKERWGPPLVDADWHAFCQAIYKDTHGVDWGDFL